jgi:hypothetical protein
MAASSSTPGESKAAKEGWTSGELFDVKAGLVWRLVGERVEGHRR